MDLNMSKKTFVIAGGSTGVVKQVVSELVKLGHNVVFGDLDVKNGQLSFYDDIEPNKEYYYFYSANNATYDNPWKGGELFALLNNYIITGFKDKSMGLLDPDL